MGRKTQYDQIYQRIKGADDALSNFLNKKDYTKEDVDGIKTDNQEVNQAVQMAKYMYSNGLESVSVITSYSIHYTKLYENL